MPLLSALSGSPNQPRGDLDADMADRAPVGDLLGQPGGLQFPELRCEGFPALQGLAQGHQKGPGGVAVVPPGGGLQVLRKGPQRLETVSIRQHPRRWTGYVRYPHFLACPDPLSILRQLVLQTKARAELKEAIEATLDTGLPRAFTPDLYRAKCSAVFEHVYESYPERNTGVYSQAM